MINLKNSASILTLIINPDVFKLLRSQYRYYL